MYQEGYYLIGGDIMCKLQEINTNFDSSVYVADNKSKLIECIIELAKDCTDIDAIILFGSALETRCKKNSDIDIAIISKKTINALSEKKSFRQFKDSIYLLDMSQEYDFLYFKSIDEIEKKKDTAFIFKEFAEKGKIIYKRQAA